MRTALTASIGGATVRHFNFTSFRKRGVAQPGRALHWGCRGRWFKSSRPDHTFLRRTPCGFAFFVLHVFSPVNGVFWFFPSDLKPKTCHLTPPHSGQILRLLSVLRLTNPLFFRIGHHSIRQYEPLFPTTPKAQPLLILTGHHSIWQSELLSRTSLHPQPQCIRQGHL